MTLKNFNQTGVQNFAVAGNWTPSGIPGFADDAEINSTAFVSSTAAETVNSIGLGSNNVLNIQNSSTFTTNNGTGPNKNSGLISISGLSALAVEGGTFNNPGTIELEGANANNVARLLFEDSPVTLSGGGTIEMAIGGGPQANFIGSENSLATPIVTNDDNTISGDGTIGGGIDFTNDGTIETNNNTSNHGGTIVIGTVTDPPMAPFGAFNNSTTGTVRADDGGAVILGQDQVGESFTNLGSIDVASTGDLTKLEIAGNVSIVGGFIGSDLIGLGGSGAQAGDEIVSDGKAATLTLIKQTLKGAGTIGDNNLTINNESGTIVANLAGETLSLGGSPGAPLFTTGGTLEATGGGILNAINSPIANSGTITAVSGGVVELGSVLSTGAIDIGAGSSVSSSSEIIGNITFTGSGANLIIENSLPNGGIDGELVGAVAGDTIDLAAAVTPYAASNQVIWQQTAANSGVLSLVSSSNATLVTLNLAGSYSTAQFTVASDRDAGTLITVVNAPPPAATTADMIMSDTGGDYEIYDLGNNAIQAASGLGQISTSWQVAGLGGFNGTDTSDMLLRDPGNGQLEIYDVSNNNIGSPIPIGQVGSPWTVAGFGDFSGHANETDMLMQNSATGQFEVYDISNNQIVNAVSMGQVGTAWQVAGFGDFSSHAGETGDMLMRNGSTGAFEVYDISNNQISAAAALGQVGLEWQVAGFGDFSGNANETDMLMRNSATGAFEIYDISNNAIYNAASMGQVGLEWQVTGFGPINGAGTSDMLMRDGSTGAFEVYDIGNNKLTTAASMGQVGPAWSVAGIAADPATAPASQLVQAMASYAAAGGALDAGSSPEPSAAPPDPASPLNVLNPASVPPA